MSHVPMDVVLLGNNYRYPYGLGADIGNRNQVEMATRINYYTDLGYSTSDAIVKANADYDKDHGTASAAGVDNTIRDALLKNIPGAMSLASEVLRTAITKQQPGMSYDQVSAMMASIKGQDSSGFDFQKNMPYIVIGGVALVAVIMMVGTKSRRS